MKPSSIQNSMQMTESQTQAWENWNIRTHQERLEIVSVAVKKLNDPLTNWLLPQLERMEETIDLPGPTGEANSLSWEGRGLVAVCYDDDASITAITAQLMTALVCGNLIVLQSHRSDVCQLKTLFIENGIPETLIQLTDSSLYELAQREAIALYAYSGTETSAIQLDQKLAERGGALPQLVYESDFTTFSAIVLQDYPWRFVTESTLSVNTTAVGGNATLLELGGKSDT